MQCDPTIFKILYKWAEAEIIEIKDFREKEIERISKTFNNYNILQIMISADYLVMKSLKDRCIEFFRKNAKNLLRDAYECVTLVQSYPIKEVPIDQIEIVLFEEIVKLLYSDFKAIVRII